MKILTKSFVVNSETGIVDIEAFMDKGNRECVGFSVCLEDMENTQASHVLAMEQFLQAYSTSNFVQTECETIANGFRFTVMTGNHATFLKQFIVHTKELFQTPEYQGVAQKMTAEVLAAKMTEGLLTGTADKDGKACKLTCKSLGIKHSYKAIKEYLLTV